MRWAFITLAFVASAVSFAQIRQDQHDRLYPTLLDKHSHVTNVQSQKIRALFETVEDGIANGRIGDFSKNFDRQIFVNITRGENGYFSSGQASALLQHYFDTRKVVSFKFSRLNEDGPTPYATGRLATIYRGTLESAQVYVSCTWQTNGWVIGQLNIY